MKQDRIENEAEIGSERQAYLSGKKYSQKTVSFELEYDTKVHKWSAEDGEMGKR